MKTHWHLHSCRSCTQFSMNVSGYMAQWVEACHLLIWRPDRQASIRVVVKWRKIRPSQKSQALVLEAPLREHKETPHTAANRCLVRKRCCSWENNPRVGGSVVHATKSTVNPWKYPKQSQEYKHLRGHPECCSPKSYPISSDPRFGTLGWKLQTPWL